jgi:chromosome segregation ATPase
MARAGLYLSDVRAARDAVLAQGKHPSIDAVRVALGNTGSKTTIHRMLRQLEEEGGGGQPLDVSQALRSLVQQLAEQLQMEAGEVLERERTVMSTVAAEQANVLEATRAQLKTAESQIDQIQAELKHECSAHAATGKALQAEQIARHTAERKAADLLARLKENEDHRLSLEEKHRHARESLEHFRQATQDQRERESQRHETEVQQLRVDLRTAQQAAIGKQEEVSRLNLDAAKLVAELSSSQRAHYAEQQTVRTLEIKLDEMRGFESQCVGLTAQLEERKEWQTLFEKQLQQARENNESIRNQLSSAQLELQSAHQELQRLKADPQ